MLISPDHTTELMIKALELLRNDYHFRGYIHAKTIAGASPELGQQMGSLADRLSVNIELASAASLGRLAPDKKKSAILAPMRQIARVRHANRQALTVYRAAPKFPPAAPSTQMIVGATPETDRQSLKLTEGLDHKYQLTRVLYSASIPVGMNIISGVTSTPRPFPGRTRR